MFLSRLKHVAEVVGLACFVLLAVLGVVSLVRGEGAARAEAYTLTALGPGFAQDPLPLDAQAVDAAGGNVPVLLNYQGVLRNPAGEPLDETVKLTFRIYNEPLDAAAPLWTEVHENVVVRGGLFNVVLGDVSALSPTLFNAPDRYLGIAVKDNAELLPRQKFASVPYAMRAEFNPAQDVPVGTVVAFAGNTPPTGWLLCNGAPLKKADYPALAAIIGFGGPTGDATRFYLPDFQGRTGIGAGDGLLTSPRTLAQYDGAETHTLTVAEMPQHNHRIVTVPDHDGTDGWVGGWNWGNPTERWTDNTGGNQPHNNMQPYVVLNYIIKY
jgi:microcystin-dependent protein